MYLSLKKNICKNEKLLDGALICMLMMLSNLQRKYKKEGSLFWLRKQKCKIGRYFDSYIDVYGQIAQLGRQKAGNP